MRIDKTRLRWFRNAKTGVIKSEEVFAGSEIMHVTIDPSEYPYQYNITDTEGKTSFALGECDTIRKAKQEAKERLKLMHARFYDEVRPQIKVSA